MTEHTFTLVFTITNDSLEPQLDALATAGCDDAAFAGPAPDGTFVADFDREAPSLADAVVSAAAALRSTLDGFHLLRVEPDDLVSQSAIAERTGRTDESIRLYVTGRRGPGSFPPALAAINHKTQIWSWAAVAAWWQEVLGEDLAGAENALFLATLNAQLRIGVLRDDQHALGRDEDLIKQIVAPELVRS